MALNGPLVRVGISGEVSVAPTGSTAPTDSTTALNAAFVGLGYISEDGLAVSPQDSTDQIHAWQNAAIVRTVRTQADWQFKCKLIETKGKTVGLFLRNANGATVVSAGQWKMLPDQTNPDTRAFVFDVVDGSKHYRYYVPNGEVIERGDVTYDSGDPVAYEVTIQAYYDSGIGAQFVVFTDDSAWGYS